MFVQVLILSLLGIVSCKRPIKCSNQTVAFKRLMRATRQFHFLAPALSVTNHGIDENRMKPESGIYAIL